MKLVSIVLSFRNEEQNIAELVERIDKSLCQLTGWKYEIIFVNDQSDDNSETIIESLQKKYPIILINMSRRFGVGPCVIAGFRNANGDAIVYMDADLQDPPEILPDLMSEYERGFDVVHTVRTKRLGESKIKMMITKLAYIIINYLSDIHLPVESGDFKLISRKALNKILDQKEFRPYIRGLSVWVGFKQAFVKYERQPRSSGMSHFPLSSGVPLTEFINGITSYSLKPLYISIFLGFSSLVFSFILMTYVLYAKIINIATPGSTGVIITISFFSGTILTCLGIIGIYLARIFEQTKGREQYVINEVKGYIKK